ncbi:MAG: cytochrome c family protein [Novosphingobium sp.]
MDDRFNTIAGWVLGAGIVALGLSSISSHYFQADKAHAPHEPGYKIEGVVSSKGGAEAEPPVEAVLAKADVAKGEAVFKKCVACHTIAPGAANGIGPNLHGVVGEGIGTGAGGFAFSDALKKHGGTWDWGNLYAWLKSPSSFATGTKMTFAGLPNPQDRADVIAYLNTQGSNKPLPAAPAAGAEAPPADAAAPKDGAAKEAAAPAAAAPAAAH